MIAWHVIKIIKKKRKYFFKTKLRMKINENYKNLIIYFK